VGLGVVGSIARHKKALLPYEMAMLTAKAGKYTQSKVQIALTLCSAGS